MRNWALLAALVLVTAVFPAASSAHVLYSCGTEYNPTGTCSYFNGDTRNPGNHDVRIDPINVAWSPYGSWADPYVHYVLNNQFGWTHECGGDQDNYRLLGSMGGGTYWGWAMQIGQQGSSGCPDPSHTCWYYGNCDRFHVRAFKGHDHPTHYENWSVSDAHHEDTNHNIDASWEYAEDTVRSLAAQNNHATQVAWTYLPRADDWFGAYYSDGWASEVNAG
jgi:hypothetical protein